MNKYGFLFAVFLSGLLFGGGLVLSGMTDPANILGFLDVSGDWNSALLVVMASAVGVAAPVFYFMRRRQRSLLGVRVDVSTRRPLDAGLVLGSAVFGVGWGLSGLCPGPGLILAASGSSGALVFVAAMSVGMLIAARFGAAR